MAAWLAEHLRETPRTIVIDNYHHCEHDPTIAAFLAGVIERTRTNTRWILATRSAAQLPFATWLAHGDADVPIGENTLRLTRAEADYFAAKIAPALDAAEQLAELEDLIGAMLGTREARLRTPASAFLMRAATYTNAASMRRWLYSRRTNGGSSHKALIFPISTRRYYRPPAMRMPRSD